MGEAGPAGAADPEGHGGQDHGPEEAAIRGAPDPGQPTRGERARHELTHLPFRPWCPACVMGRAPDDPHAAGPPDEERGVPKVSLDYGFMAREGEDGQRTILVLKARPEKVVASRCVIGKGRADPTAVPWVLEQLRRLGLGRCVLQADGELATRSFVKDIIEGVCSESTMGVAAAHSAAYDHKSNGDIERAVREVKNQVRVMDCALTRRVGPVPSTHPVFDWMVEWAGELISGAMVGKDGMTAFRRLRGRDWQPKIAEFGEQVLARRPRAIEQQHLEPRWDPVTYLGTRWGSVEHWVATADGTATRVHTIRRVPEETRWVPDIVLNITGVPSEPNKRRELGDGPVQPAVVVVPAEHEPPPRAEHPVRVPRGFRIQNADLFRHGFTEHCPKCDAVRGVGVGGTYHTAACRQRFENIFTAEGDLRVQRAQARRDGAAGGPEEAEGDAPEAPEDPGNAAADDDMENGVDEDMDEPPDQPDTPQVPAQRNRVPTTPSRADRAAQQETPVPDGMLTSL